MIFYVLNVSLTVNPKFCWKRKGMEKNGDERWSIWKDISRREDSVLIPFFIETIKNAHLGSHRGRKIVDGTQRWAAWGGSLERNKQRVLRCWVVWLTKQKPEIKSGKSFKGTREESWIMYQWVYINRGSLGKIQGGLTFRKWRRRRRRIQNIIRKENE